MKSDTVLSKTEKEKNNNEIVITTSAKQPKKAHIEHSPSVIPKINRKFKKTKLDLSENEKVNEPNIEEEKIPVVKEEHELLDSSEASLNIIYQDYLENKLTKDKMSLNNLMRVITPKIIENRLHFVLQSEQQKLLFEDIRPEVLGFVNNRLKDKLESVSVELDDSIKLGMDKPYTSAEQLEYMVNKSPELREAIERLDLRIK